MLIRNAIRTPDGTVLESRSVHDYRTYVDTVTNREYMIDGGLHYSRRSAWGDEQDLCLAYESTTHEQHRELLTWGTRGKNGDEPLHLIAIKDMDSDHIETCLNTQVHMSEMYRAVMQKELELR